MIDWLEEESRARGYDAARTSAVTADRGGRLLAARGYEPIRHFYRMAIDLDAPPPDAAVARGLRRRDAPARARSRPFTRSLEEAFADHWGHEYRAVRGLAPAPPRRASGGTRRSSGSSARATSRSPPS